MDTQTTQDKVTGEVISYGFTYDSYQRPATTLIAAVFLLGLVYKLDQCTRDHHHPLGRFWNRNFKIGFGVHE